MLFGNNMSKTFSWDFWCISPANPFSKKERSIHLQEKHFVKQQARRRKCQAGILRYQAENLIKPIPWSSVPLLLDLA